VLGGAVGCSGVLNVTATPPGKSVVTVTGMATAAATAGGTAKAHTATFTLTIQD